MFKITIHFESLEKQIELKNKDCFEQLEPKMELLEQKSMTHFAASIMNILQYKYSN
jgi:hypothetical protein